MRAFIKIIADFNFWLEVFAYLRELGPVAPIFLAFMESVLPFLPLIGVVTINVGAYGVIWGLLLSWIGACLGAFVMFTIYRKILKGWFNRLSERHRKFRFTRIRRIVGNMNGWTLFILALLPFTPIAIFNFAFGVSEYSAKKYLGILCSAKLVMISIMVMISKSVFIGLNDRIFLIIAAVLLVGFFVASKLFVRLKIKRQNV